MNTILILVAALVAGFLSTHYVIFKLKAANRIKTVLIMELKIESLLDGLLSHTILDRALLCKVHNGGSPILIGSKKKISIIVEPDSSLRPHTKETYTGYPIDKDYKQILIDMMEMENSFVIHDISKLNIGMFRRKSEADGLAEVMHYYLDESESGGYYLFLGTLTGPDMILSSNKNHNIIEEQVVLIKKLVQEAIKKKLLL